ncbi:phosphoadenosine phosphosulfate (PAPS) reductase family protein [Striga hermonthica]|uniref:FAD synthase n=1 Tax=Striga hermonthica TaxID=68872 RepID=A0A9N7NIV1_STRHE|nr:phosphoadenosine phosphosulfate (PAPS) reductase family protein [Striga hermonthica]
MLCFCNVFSTQSSANTAAALSFSTTPYGPSFRKRHTYPYPPRAANIPVGENILSIDESAFTRVFKISTLRVPLENIERVPTRPGDPVRPMPRERAETRTVVGEKVTSDERGARVDRRRMRISSVEEVAFSFNGGEDSTVLLHLLRAGYYLHCKKLSADDDERSFPIRTIYFESPSTFPEINSFTYDIASIYNLQMEISHLDFKSGLEALFKAKPIRAIFLGVRIGDPTAVGQEQFSPSSPGWPPFMRVNPILDWSYRWICKFHAQMIYLFIYFFFFSDFKSIVYIPLRKFSYLSLLALQRYMGISLDLQSSILLPLRSRLRFGTVEDRMGFVLRKKLHSVGWAVSHVSVTRNDVDSVADEVEQQKLTNDVVFIYGGVGPLPSDVTLAGVAKAFGVRTALDEEFEEYLRHLIEEKCTGDRNEMAQLPEGITELLHHEKLSVPLIKCRNVIILTATNAAELENEWKCLTELMSPDWPFVISEPFCSKRVAISLSDVEIAQPLSEICNKFPDLYIGAYRESRGGPLIVSFQGKDNERLRAAEEAFCRRFHPQVAVSALH